MAQENPASEQEKRDFFISYAEADTAWAEWLGAQLEQQGYTTLLSAWDFRPGANLPLETHRALLSTTRTLLVLTPAVMQAVLTQAHWSAAFFSDPTGTRRPLVPIRVEACDLGGLLAPLIPVDLVGLDEQEARARLLEGIQDERSRPAAAPFPGQRAQVPFPGAFPPVWHVPFARNPAFTGREEELRALHERLHQQHQAAISQPQSISGLGGIGKTQLAIEYAYRHRGDYTAVLWVSADTTDTLTASYNELAAMLALPERAAREQDIIVRAVQTWLRTTPDYLLIFDNADTPDVLLPFLPTTVAGHVLLTTRAADLSDLGLGLDDPLALPILTPKEGAHLLLQRAGMLAQATPDEHQQARQISRELGGLPLALDQAGAYVRKSRITLADYFQRYQQHQARLLGEGHSHEHPMPVSTTWKISFDAVEAQNPAAADLLRFCSFLAPDAIPEELLATRSTKIGSHLASIATDQFALDNAIMALRAHSLIECDPQQHTLTVHRLVQAAVRDSLSADLQRKWKYCVILALSKTFPRTSSMRISFADWSLCECLLPHVQMGAFWIEQTALHTNTAASMLYDVGVYLYLRGRFVEAESLCQQALIVYEQILGGDNIAMGDILNIATSNILHDLAWIYKAQGKYEKVESTYWQAMSPFSKMHYESFYDYERLYKECQRLLKEKSIATESRIGTVPRAGLDRAD